MAVRAPEKCDIIQTTTRVGPPGVPYSAGKAGWLFDAMLNRGLDLHRYNEKNRSVRWFTGGRVPGPQDLRFHYFSRRSSLGSQGMILRTFGARAPSK